MDHARQQPCLLLLLLEQPTQAGLVEVGLDLEQAVWTEMETKSKISGIVVTWPLGLPFNIGNTNLQSPDASPELSAFAVVKAAIHRMICGFE